MSITYGQCGGLPNFPAHGREDPHATILRVLLVRIIPLQIQLYYYVWSSSPDLRTDVLRAKYQLSSGVFACRDCIQSVLSTNIGSTLEPEHVYGSLSLVECEGHLTNVHSTTRRRGPPHSLYVCTLRSNHT